MTLADDKKKQLRARGHALKPVIQIGQAGLTENVLIEIEQALEHHELMKIKVRVGDRRARDAVIDQLVSRTGAELVQRIGHIALVYRPRRAARSG